MIKNPYQKDYQNELKQNRHGLLVTRTSYQGDFYVLPFDEQQKRRTGILNVIWTIALWVIELGMGLINTDSSRTAWIVFPYLFVILPLGYMLYGAVSYIGAPVRMHRAHYETGLLRMKRSCIGAMVLTGIGAVLDLVYMVLHRGEIRMGMECIYLICHFLFLAVAFFFGKYYDRNYSGILIENATME